MKPARTTAAAVLLSSLALATPSNDNARPAHSSWPCLDLCCDRCMNALSPEGSAPGGDVLRELAEDPEGRAHVARRQRGDVAHQLRRRS